MTTRTVVVPRVTSETLAAMEALAPGICDFNNMRVIDWVTSAEVAAYNMVEDGLPENVRISYDPPEIVTTDTGWVITYTLVSAY